MSVQQLEAGDVLIRRVRNGWVVISAGDESLDTSVYSDDERPYSEVAASHALLSAIQDHFDSHFRSKWRGGIEASVHDKGRDAEEDE